MNTVNYSASVVSAAQAAGVDPNLALAVMQQESGGNPGAISGSGAVGLFQLMPSSFPGVNINDPITNIDTGVGYLAQLLNQYNGNVALALAAYNAGPGTVANYGNTIPPYPETQNYVSSILVALGISSDYNSDGSLANSDSGGSDISSTLSQAVSDVGSNVGSFVDSLDFTDPTTIMVVTGALVAGAAILIKLV